MSKEFNPDEFLAETAPIAESQADIERRNRERAASGQAPLTPAEVANAASPSGPSMAPKPAEFSQEPGRWAVENVVAPAYGVGKAAADVGSAALSNPAVQTGLELAGGGYAAKRFLVNPVLEALKPVGQAVGQKASGITDALNRQAAAAEAAERGVASREAARQAARAGAVRPVAPTPTYNVPTGGIPQTNMPVPGQGPVAPTAPAQPMPANAANAARGAATAAEPGNWMSKALNMAKQYGPAMAKIGTGIGAATYSPSLGPAVPSTGRMRGMEINPLTGRPWTPEQIAQYEANPAVFDRQMAAPQFRR